MGNWASSAVTLEPINFDGDTIVIEVDRLKTTDMSKLAGHYSEGKLSFATQLELVTVAQAILPERLRSVSGMFKADGSAFTKDELIAVLPEFYFTPLVSHILNGVITASSVQNVKN